jgi:hypothetical protein
MRLIGSSDPDAVARDRALSLLAERAVLTRAVCRELLETGDDYVSRRTRTSLLALLRWVATHYPASFRVEPRPDDGIEDMVQPAGAEAVVAEIRAGATVCSAFFTLLTADTLLQVEGDSAKLRSALDDYWARHGTPALVPQS